MRLAVIGSGYVGLVSGVCFSELGNEVICVDNANEKIELLNSGEVPIYEKGLKELISNNVKAGRLSFTSDLTDAVRSSQIIIIAVGTPSLPNGEANLAYIEQVAQEIGKSMNDYKVIMVKSTVPVGTNEKIAAIIRSYTNNLFDVVSVPEFLREGTAIIDAMNPDRIIIGTTSLRAANLVMELHRPLTDQIIITDVRSSEMIKYASNAFLATKISFINEIANICEKVGADVQEVAKGMGTDSRIGSSFLKAGIGYGGSCFPKDTQALIQIAGQMDYDFKLLKAVVEVNREQRYNVIRKLEEMLGEIEDKTIGIWGLAFKPETDDVRDAPAFEIIETLLKLGAQVKAYDPIASRNFEKNLNRPEVKYCTSAMEAAENADALCILTEWREFIDIPLSIIQNWLKAPNLIDGRNIYRKEDLEETPFAYYSIGRPKMNNGVKETNSFISF
ncbi:UDP-glucose/GDP-mannose dehydrogenase family protein [Paenibacillus glycanilyticus]|uniref:UDP-glucose dehydrogenase family protein n=1 Tax=Paenibacillus glycanilyticus TaxID=126569 RepID=UPI00203B7D0C|nr:UDP-glucose/GDP-mannose dehydrogenase family protein [Paenibacillus glycanilyticus]MCM3630346.1 UDP-glucose/GDP-mannose dehydrogenase family protein [Paenibacillus glycanilyticus]